MTSLGSLVLLIVLLLPIDVSSQQPPSPFTPPAIQPIPDKTDPFPKKGEPAPPAPGPPPSSESRATSGEQAPPGTVLITGFTISGNAALGTWELAPILTPYVGKAVGLKELEAITDLVTEEYRRRGYTLAKAYIPEQRIKAGIVEIGILEGRLGQLDVTGNNHYSTAYIRRYFAGIFEEGAIRYGTLERALLLLNENPDLSVSALLQPGGTPGTTDIVAKAKDKRPIHLVLSVDNFGFPVISRERYSAGLEIGNALFDGAVASANLIFGNDPRSLFFQYGSYSVPVNGQGTRLVVSGSNGRFDVGGALAVLKITGKIRTYDISVIHPIRKTRIDNLYVDAGFLSKDNPLFILDTLSGTDSLRMLKLGFSYDRSDEQGRTFVSLYGYQGLGKVLGGMADDAPQANRLGADNRFSKLNVAASRTQSLWGGTYLLVRGAGQLSDGVLPFIEEVFMGGAETVRGYSMGERIGDEGYNISAEARFPLPYIKDAQFVMFIDNGAVRVRGAQVGEQSYYSLTGWGPGLRLGLPYYDTTVRVDLGFPIEPSKPVTGTLSGGSSPTLYFMVGARL